MLHLQDCFELNNERFLYLLDNQNIKVNLKVDGFPVKVVRDEITGRIMITSCSRNELYVGTDIEDILEDFFSERQINLLLNIKRDMETNMKYNFICFEAYNDDLYLISVLDDTNTLIFNINDLDKIAQYYSTRRIHTIWSSPFNEHQKQLILLMSSTGIIPKDEEYINVMFKMFNADNSMAFELGKLFEGLVFFFNDNGLEECKFVDTNQLKCMISKSIYRREMQAKNIEIWTELFELVASKDIELVFKDKNKNLDFNFNKLVFKNKKGIQKLLNQLKYDYPQTFSFKERYKLLFKEKQDNLYFLNRTFQDEINKKIDLLDS